MKSPLHERPLIIEDHSVAHPPRAFASNVGHEDMHLLAMTLIEEQGLEAIPALERKYPKMLRFSGPVGRDSIAEGAPR